MCSSSQPEQPATPDYKGAAQETSAGNIEAARAATAANRINEYGPFGQKVYSQNGPDTWSSTISLDPRAQKTLDTQMNLSNQMGDLTSQAMGPVGQQGPMDIGSVQGLADQSYQAQTARLDPQWQQNQNQQQTQLANQGLAPGGEAYDNAMRTFNQGKNDAYSQARLNAQATMPQTYQLASSIYNQPLNRANALRTGAQIQNPTFQPAGMQQATPGANMLGAAQAQGQYGQGLYNTQIGQNNAMMGGLFSLGSAAMGIPGLFG